MTRLPSPTKCCVRAAESLAKMHVQHQQFCLKSLMNSSHMKRTAYTSTSSTLNCLPRSAHCRISETNTAPIRLCASDAHTIEMDLNRFVGRSSTYGTFSTGFCLIRLMIEICLAAFNSHVGCAHTRASHYCISAGGGGARCMRLIRIFWLNE